MNYNFYIIDDDISVIKILSNIIIKHKLGDVCGFSAGSETLVEEIKSLKPDIVLVDLLLPKRDGITLTHLLKPELPETPFIMISEVYAKDMVSKAYNAGIEFYINKPINVIEVLNVIRNIDEKIQMKRVINSFETAFKNIQGLNTKQSDGSEKAIVTHDVAYQILSHLGIASEVGTADIINLVAFLTGVDDGITRRVLDFKLSDLYLYLSDKYEKERGEVVNVKTIEQRIRRTISEGLTNLSEMGLQDYDHIYFSRYNNTLYDFREVRKEMERLKGNTMTSGKINIRKFFSGITMILQNEQYF